MCVGGGDVGGERESELSERERDLTWERLVLVDTSIQYHSVD